jgi:hypothetical protein
MTFDLDTMRVVKRETKYYDSPYGDHNTRLLRTVSEGGIVTTSAWASKCRSPALCKDGGLYSNDDEWAVMEKRAIGHYIRDPCEQSDVQRIEAIPGWC